MATPLYESILTGLKKKTTPTIISQKPTYTPGSVFEFLGNVAGYHAPTVNSQQLGSLYKTYGFTDPYKGYAPQDSALVQALMQEYSKGSYTPGSIANPTLPESVLHPVSQPDTGAGIQAGVTVTSHPTGTYVDPVTKESYPVANPTPSQTYQQPAPIAASASDWTPEETLRAIANKVGQTSSSPAIQISAPATTGAIDTNYQMTPAEIQEQIATGSSPTYTARIATYRAQKASQGLTGSTGGGTMGGATISGGTIGTGLASTNSSDVLKAVQNMLGISGTSDAQSQIADLISKMSQQEADYTSALKTQPTAEETYNKYRTMLGLPAQEAEYTAAKKGVLTTQQTISDTENLLNKLEGDINSRIQSMGGVNITEAQRRRILAGEQKPLTQQLADLSQTLGKQTTAAGMEQEDVTGLQSQLATLLGLSEKDTAAALEAAKEPLSFSESLLPTLSSLAQYESPKEKLAASIAQEELYKSLGLGTYATQDAKANAPVVLSPGDTYYDPATGESLTTPAKPSTTAPKTISTSGGILQWDEGSGTWKSTGYSAPAAKAPSTKTTTTKPAKVNYTDVVNALSAVKIPSTVASKTTVGELNKSYLDKLVKNGVPADTAQGIWEEILKGTTLEEIRQYFRDQSVDPKVLDKFMMTLQGLM